MLYLEWDGFVAVLESWTNVVKSDTDLKTELVLYVYTYTLHVHDSSVCVEHIKYHVHVCIDIHIYMQYT